MVSLPYYFRYTSNAIKGMQPLTLEERGAYNTIIDLIYDNGGPIRDDSSLLAYLGCDPRVWRRVRASLLSKEKIVVLEDGRIANSRATLELAKAERRQEIARTSGVSSGEVRRKSSKKANKNNGNRELARTRTKVEDALTEQSSTSGDAARSPDGRAALPEKVRVGLLKGLGQDAFDSYCARAAWDDDTRTLTPATGQAHTILGRERKLFAELEITLGEKVRLTVV